MPSTPLRRSLFRGHRALVGGLATALVSTLALTACKNTTSLAGGSGGGSTGTGGSDTGGSGGGGDLLKASKVDILFGIDNSRSMADKQQVLALALSDLITGLTNPPCLDSGGNYVSQPGALVPCPEGSSRQYQPVGDIHIGIVSSSLGGHGSDACASPGFGNESNNDKAHLLSRTDPEGGAEVLTYQDKGFLAWDPAQTLVPPGEDDPAVILQSFSDMVLGVGQIGCGYEAQLESWYRFLADPEPVDTVTLSAQDTVLLQGIDAVVMEQRKAFLRPDSMLVIVSLSDENDCSIKEEGQFYVAAQQKSGNGAAFHLPRARAVCETNPNDQCCFSCGQTGPKDSNGNDLCAADPQCKSGDGKTLYHDELSDNINLRCFDQKRRFGIDFLYPTERYVSALTSSTVVDRSGQLVPNPIFSDLDPGDSASQIRDPGLVVFAGIIGVPWQDIAKNPGDLTQGFKTSAELLQENAGGQTTWDIILGDPANDVQPADPFMRESTEPRSGTNPVTSESITQPLSPLNSINGHEYTIAKRDDLQYACIMPLPEARDCSVASTAASCDCQDAQNDNPLCEEDPVSGDRTRQIKAKAYPSLRQLSVLKGVGSQAVVGSICATQITDATLPNYAYRPVVASLLDRMKSRLQ